VIGFPPRPGPGQPPWPSSCQHGLLAWPWWPIERPAGHAAWWSCKFAARPGENRGAACCDPIELIWGRRRQSLSCSWPAAGVIAWPGRRGAQCGCGRRSGILYASDPALQGDLPASEGMERCPPLSLVPVSLQKALTADLPGDQARPWPCNWPVIHKPAGMASCSPWPVNALEEHQVAGAVGAKATLASPTVEQERFMVLPSGPAMAPSRLYLLWERGAGCWGDGSAGRLLRPLLARQRAVGGGCLQLDNRLLALRARQQPQRISRGVCWIHGGRTPMALQRQAIAPVVRDLTAPAREI